jgi:hypothetical protein
MWVTARVGARAGHLHGGKDEKVYAEDWNRTSDTSIFSAVLYRLSYLGVREPRSDRTLIITAPAIRSQAAALRPVLFAIGGVFSTCTLDRHLLL